MSVSLTDIAQTLKDAKHKTKAKDARESDVTVQLIYAFNGTGKTRLSQAFKSLVVPKADEDTEQVELEAVSKKILYYNAFTEDLFYWDNDLENDVELKLKIHPNSFTRWVFKDQGQDGNVISNFQRYTDKKLTPYFNEEYIIENKDGKM